ncbi:hypothetical protein E4U19_007159 [Claviceps sp. Clav32 group G5]|nr:hypothetical protein E4U19_007159 [Claviceps sp. Clav32 group G5]KAG6044973.1 hypothetical protein E4U39_002827 [Claviceps sp. Clav50 group G5]
MEALRHIYSSKGKILNLSSISAAQDTLEHTVHEYQQHALQRLRSKACSKINQPSRARNVQSWPMSAHPRGTGVARALCNRLAMTWRGRVNSSTKGSGQLDWLNGVRGCGNS